MNKINKCTLHSKSSQNTVTAITDSYGTAAMSGIWNYSGMLPKEYMACMTAVTGLWLNVLYSVALVAK